MFKLSILLLVGFVAVCSARPADLPAATPSTSSAQHVPFNEEVVVESALVVRPKPPAPRTKRQFGGGQGFGGGFGGGPQYGQSSALANANSYGQYSGPGGFGASSGMGQAQAFNAQGPLGGFGASAANTATQGFHAGPGGLSGSAGMSGSQAYNLPGGRTANVAYGGTFSHNNGVGSGSQSNGVTFT